LFQLFTGDGIIQGVFLENGNITQVNHIIQTEKIKYEKKHGKFTDNMMILPWYMFLNKIGMLPNVMGLANTAFMKVKKKIFVLFERDLPYEISLDFKEKTIETVKKINIHSVDHFSAHSTLDGKKHIVYSLEYNVLKNVVTLFHTNEDLGLLKKIDVSTHYIPIIHDSYVLSDSTIFTDSPFYFSFSALLKGKIPVIFNPKKPTYIHEICRKTGNKTTYVSEKSFYIFHYATMKESASYIEIYAPIYDSVDFSKLDIAGKYRRLILDKKTRTIKMEKNPELEKYNLDFPMKWRDSYILRNIENNRINGFIICDGLKIKNKIFLQDLSICGEPKIYDSGVFSRIMCLGYDSENRGYFVLIDPENGDVYKFPLQENVKIGFHSIYTSEELKK
jgi:carotenoid cleavage dioxygenase-like enzyme